MSNPLSRRNLLFASSAVVLVGLLAVMIAALLTQRAKLEEQRKSRESEVHAVLDAAPQAVPALLEALAPYRDEIRPVLQEAVNQPAPNDATHEVLWLWRQHRARAALALLAEEPAQKELLTARLLEAELDPAEMLLVRDALKPYAAAAEGRPVAQDKRGRSCE